MLHWLAPFACLLSLLAQDPGKAPATQAPPTKAAAAEVPPADAASPVGKGGPVRFRSFPVPDAPPLDVAEATTAAIAAILLLQEGDGPEQWPYEGVYREDRGELPVGYRVGGTAITCLGLLAAPGFAQDAARQQAVRRGLDFVLRTLEHPRLQVDFLGTYDVRGWGHIYALELLLQLQERELVPAPLTETVAKRTQWLVQALVESAIPERGGWNYSRPAGYLSPKNPASTFMTAPALLALFRARQHGIEVDELVVEQALGALDRARALPGGYAYGAPATSQHEVDEPQLPYMNKTPSSAARATACEATLLLAGRGDPARLERAVDRFFADWDELARRKSQTGTHVRPYGIAPYYFLYGHLYCALAIELLTDQAKQVALRQRLRAVLAKSRDADGSWNDRQFGRSAGYGTAVALLVMHMPQQPAPATWRPAAAVAPDATR